MADGETVIIGSVPGSAKVAALEAYPAVALTIDTSAPTRPPNALLIRGTASVSQAGGVFPEHVEGALKVTPEEEFPRVGRRWNALYDQMVRIDVTATCVTSHEFGARLPQAVEALVKSKWGGQNG